MNTGVVLKLESGEAYPKVGCKKHERLSPTSTQTLFLHIDQAIHYPDGLHTYLGV
jgi:hypothetical protein